MRAIYHRSIEIASPWRKLYPLTPPLLKDRAYLIKLSGALQRIRLACFRIRQNRNISLADHEVVLQIEGRFGQLGDSENGFRELTVLRDYYQNRLTLSEGEIQQLLHITGEYGQSLRQRLALPEPAPASPVKNWQEILEVATALAPTRYRSRGQS